MSSTNAFTVPGCIETPSLLVDLDILEQNLDEMAAICAESNTLLLPHAKTHRTPAIGRMQVSRGADGLCVAKLGEAEAFAGAGVKRITVAYPVVGDAKARRALRLSEGIKLALAADSIEGARSIGSVFAEENREIEVLLIIDSGLGRCGVAPADAPGVARVIANVPGIRLGGVMTHEGWVYAARDREDLRRRSESAANLMVATAEAIRRSGVSAPVVSPGASASARIVARAPGVTEVRPGIYAFNDLGQIALGNATPATCAVRVLATVVSHPDPTRAFIDAGSKTLSQDGLPAAAHSEAFPGHGLVVGRPGWQVERLSEEHGWLRWRGSTRPTSLSIGERIQIIPNHVCTVFSSLGESYALRGGELVDTWTTVSPGASR